MSSKEQPQIIDESGDKYKYGFVTDIDADTVPMGLNEDIIRLISRKKGEPDWLLDWRLKAYEFWQTMKEPSWAKLTYDKIDYQSLCYYSAPKQKAAPKSLDEVDSELLKTYEKLGIPLKEQEALAGVVAVDAVFDSVSVATTYRAKHFRSRSRASRSGAPLSRFGRSLYRQFFCLPEFGSLYRRIVRLYSQRRPLSDGIVDLFPH